MKYPSSPEHGEWYLWVNTGFKVDVEGNRVDGNKINSAFLQINQEGDSNPGFDHGYVELAKEDFADQWFALLETGKKKVDALNFNPERSVIPGTNQCANCDQSAQAEDFLCAECRGRE